MTTLYRSTLATPLGDLVVVWDATALHALYFDGVDDTALRDTAIPEAPAPDWLRAPLDAYWQGDMHSLHAIPCAASGTPFQEAVWQLLRTIPAGETQSYGALAARLGKPTASRAVGAANGANPISLVVPCHRVIGANGALTGYAQGIERKQWLLAHERTHAR